MKSTFLKLAFLFIATSCVCGICSKDDAGSNNNSGSNNNNVEPDLKPDATWLYFNDAASLVYYHPENTRPTLQKWLATKIEPAYVGMLDSTKNIHFLTWSFENTGDTRFLSNKLNPNGKEQVSIFIPDFPNTPGPINFTKDFNCWYNVYTSTGVKYDSTRYQALKVPQLNITKMELVESFSSHDRYKMSGTADFNVMYWPPGTATTSDVHNLQCTFNNVFIDFSK